MVRVNDDDNHDDGDDYNEDNDDEDDDDDDDGEYDKYDYDKEVDDSRHDRVWKPRPIKASNAGK